MGMFGDLMNKIFHAASVAERPPDVAPPRAPQATPAPTPAAPAAAATAVMTEVDVTTTLDGLAAKNKERLDWRHSIVDLMKLVGMDSSLSARKALATDLKYTGDMNDSAAMNVWLHKEVMRKLADNGGKIPSELLAR